MFTNYPVYTHEISVRFSIKTFILFTQSNRHTRRDLIYREGQVHGLNTYIDAVFFTFLHIKFVTCCLGVITAM
jgi:hypothetical protein